MVPSPRDLCRTTGRPHLRAQGLLLSLNWYLNALATSPVSAVCIPPGARLQLQDIPVRLQRKLDVSPNEEVTFFQRTSVPYTYRDAIRFANGQEILLQELGEGLR